MLERYEIPTPFWYCMLFTLQYPLFERKSRQSQTLQKRRHAYELMAFSSRYRLAYCLVNGIKKPALKRAFLLNLHAYRFKPRLRNNASTLGSCPRNLMYNCIGSSVPPRSKIFLRNDDAFS